MTEPPEPVAVQPASVPLLLVEESEDGLAVAMWSPASGLGARSTHRRRGSAWPSTAARGWLVSTDAGLELHGWDGALKQRWPTLEAGAVFLDDERAFAIADGMIAATTDSRPPHKLLRWSTGAGSDLVRGRWPYMVAVDSREGGHRARLFVSARGRATRIGNFELPTPLGGTYVGAFVDMPDSGRSTGTLTLVASGADCGNTLVRLPFEEGVAKAAVELHELAGESPWTAVAVHGGFAWVAAGERGLLGFPTDFQPGSEPVVLPATAHDVHVENGMLWSLVDEPRELVRVDVRDGQPVIAERHPTAGNWTHIAR